MQDPHIPPVVEEGEIGGAVAGVRLTMADTGAATGNRSTAESIPHPWITVTAPTWAAITTTAMAGVAASDLDFPQPMRPLNPILYPQARTIPPASSLSSMTCSFRPRFRRRRGN